MSLDDLAAAAWADDASPGNSPKLSEQDIWGAPRLQRGDEAEDAGLQQEVPLGIVAETPSSEKDVWNSGEGEASVSLSTDIAPEPSQEATSDTDNPRKSKNESGIPGNTAPAPLEDAKSVAIPAAKESGVPIAEPTTQIPAVNNENEDEDEGFDNFDDQPFATPSSAFPAAGPSCDDEKTALESNQDDFGDFGDFEDFDDAAVQNPGADVFGSESRDVVGLGGEFTDEPEESVWDDPDRPPPLKSLSLEPFPPADLTEQISTLLSHIFPSRDDPSLTGHLTRESIRQIDGQNQILYTEASRELYAQLVTPPQLKPLDWKRSRTRREQLISLGIPVNLDEVDTSRLPPLKITTKEGQAALAAAEGRNGNRGSGPSRQRTKDERKVGEMPPFDRERADRLLSYREDQLSLVPAAYLSRMQQDLVSACSSASAVVAYLKQIRDVRMDDNKQKNDQIASLIAQAQRIKAAESASGGGGGGVFRKASVKHRSSMSLSGGTTPRRVNSPGMGR